MRIVGNDPALSRQITATASGAISAAGKPLVVNTDGTVTAVETTSLTQSAGSSSVFESAETLWANATFDSSNNKIVISYQDAGNSNYGTAIVATIDSSNNTVSYGSPVVFNSAGTQQGKITFDSYNNKVVIAYNNAGDSGHGYAIVGTVSGTSISFGSAAEFENAVISDPAITFDSSNNKVVIAYRDEGNSNYGTAIVGTVSGTSISYGSAAVYESANASETGIAFDSSNNKVVIVYQDGGNSDYGTAIVGTVSSTSISFGSAAVFESANSVYIAATFDSNSNKVVVAYSDGGNSFYGTAIVGTVSSTSISFGSATVFESANSQYIAATFDSNSNKVVITYRDSGNSNYGTAIVGTVSGTSISFGSPTVFENGNSQYISATFDSNSNKVLVAYRNYTNSEYGTAVVFQNASTSENLTTENFIGTSAHSAADGAKVLVNTQGAVDENQSGLTAGQTFFVDKNGALQLTTNVSASLATAVVFEAAATKVPDVCFDTTNNRIVVAYQDDANSDYGTAIVGTVASDGSISFGTPVVFESAATGSQGLGIEHDSNSNKVVIAYNDSGNSNHGTAIVGTVDSSDNSISFGSATVFNSGNTSSPDVIFDSNSNKIVITYRDDANGYYGTAIIGTVSGTSISFGSEAVFESAETNYISGVFDSTNNKIVIAYNDGNDSGKGKAVVGTVSGTSISYGTVVTFENADTRWTSLAHDSSNEKTVIAYHDSGNSDYPTAIVGTVSGTDISFGTAVVIQSTANYGTATAFNSSVNKVVVTYKDNTGTDLRIIDGTVSGTSISFESNVEILDGGGFTSINSVAGANHAVRNVFDSNVNKTISVYSQFNNSSYGTAIAYTSGNDTSGSLSTDAVTAGTALSATKLLVKG